MPCIREAGYKGSFSNAGQNSKKESYPVAKYSSKDSRRATDACAATEDPKGTIDTNLVGESPFIAGYFHTASIK